ncbi:CaiB/BaiF CoA-transferase family protein [Tsukamurella sp. NPDC003166]|uniref:CaiB/BaiF CoA transferase family protein n=1 Tax=Tsukamurella sp. NPDC003166 TaxID=3154444 RepID=UPI0033AB380C
MSDTSHIRRPASGPLVGVRVLELGGVGPTPFTSMLLADLGADVVRIDRPAGYDGGAPVAARFHLLQRGKRSIALDLKDPADVRTALDLAAHADIVIEGFRPGVAERLGVGPEQCLSVNPSVVYGRMTGYGQTGPLAAEPGHDIDYIALTGVLHSVGVAGGPPVIPLNLAGDFGGGSLYLVMGLLAAVIEARTSGSGQVIDAAMVDGAASLMTLFHGLREAGYWTDERGVNRLDSGAPWYSVYRAADGEYVAIGANEARFFSNLLDLLGIDPADAGDQHDRAAWPRQRELIAAAIAAASRDEWAARAAGREVCLAPVLTMGEAPAHPHLAARGTYIEVDEVVQPAPAPRFSRTPGAVRNGPVEPGSDTAAVLEEWLAELPSRRTD